MGKIDLPIEKLPDGGALTGPLFEGAAKAGRDAAERVSDWIDAIFGI